jgi:hypothetical protein
MLKYLEVNKQLCPHIIYLERRTGNFFIYYFKYQLVTYNPTLVQKLIVCVV